MRVNRLAAAAATGLIGAALVPCIAGAQSPASYPVKQVRVVIPWPPGGSNDIVGRVVFQKLSQTVGQQFVIDNRPGAAGSIGADVVAKAPADGYTLMVHSTTHVGNGTLYRKLPYDVLKDFRPVILLAAQPGAMVVHPSLPAKTVREFIALAKQRPGQITYSSSGNGSAPHMQMALFIGSTGVDVVHVPYKGGPPAVTAIVSGETQVMLATIATVIPHLQSKRLRAVAVTGAKQTKVLPGLPTIAESGVPGYEMDPWIMVFAPGGTPREIVDAINERLNAVLRQPDVAQNLFTQALDPLGGSADEAAKRAEADFHKYAKLIKLTNARVE
jgi:tripartite-type tricarboxylate transporter receptor subunit TctC